MGAVYLDLRSRGYVGPAILADSNRCIADFWRMVHNERLGPSLLEGARSLESITDATLYYEQLHQDEPDLILRVAKFLWLTNYSYANVAPIYRGNGTGWIGSGCKLTSAEKWNKIFPWKKCVDRLSLVIASLRHLPCEILDSAESIQVNPDDVVYADPPYLGRRGYSHRGKNNKEVRDFAPLIFGWKAKQILYSESRTMVLPPGWREEKDVEVIARASRSKDAGAIGKRLEHLYSFRESEDWFW